jgi:hypothetical protein
MSSDLSTALIVIGFLGVMCLGVLIVFGLGYLFIVRPNIERTKVVNQNWEAFAREKGFTFARGGYPRLDGTYRGREVRLAVVNPRYDFDGTTRFTPGQTSSSRIMLTRASAGIKDDSPDLTVYKRGLLDNLTKDQDLVLGNEAFDTKFRVLSGSPERVKSILTPEIQAALVERQISLLASHKGTIQLNAVGIESRKEVLEAFLDLACRIAEAIERS